MDIKPKLEAWNNFVMRSNPTAYEVGSSKRSAAIANLFMGLANNGGINSFLTCSCDLDASEVVDALFAVGAHVATKQLGNVLRGLGSPLPASSHDVRWTLLDENWSDALNDFDVLSADADRELMKALERDEIRLSR
jgi:hypothetical protein